MISNTEKRGIAILQEEVQEGLVHLSKARDRLALFGALSSAVHAHVMLDAAYDAMDQLRIELEETE